MTDTPHLRADSTLLRVPKLLKTWAPALSLFAVVLGVIYQTSYWRQFHIDAMSYMGLQDVVRISILPLGLITLLTFASMTLPRRTMSPLVRVSAQFRGWKKPAIDLAVLGVMLPLLLLALWNGYSVWYLIVSVVLGYLVASVERGSVLKGIQPASARLGVFAALVVAPAVAWFAGDDAARTQINDEAFYVAVVPSSLLRDIPYGKPDEPLYYVGHINDYDFFRIDQRTVVVFRSEAIPTFTLEHHDAKPTRVRLPFRDPPSWAR